MLRSLRLSFSAESPVFSFISNHMSLALRSPRVLIAAGVGAAAIVGVASYVLRRPKPSDEELERVRREALARTGRITDGTILDTMRDATPGAAQGALSRESDSGGSELSKSSGLDADSTFAQPPQIIVYNYRIAGVSYECAQDVSTLADHVHGIRTDLPIQVRYAPQNPGNSIVVAESWSGLRLISANPFHADSRRTS